LQRKQRSKFKTPTHAELSFSHHIFRLSDFSSAYLQKMHNRPSRVLVHAHHVFEQPEQRSLLGRRDQLTRAQNPDVFEEKVA